MRVKNSLKNIYMSILTQIIITILGFVSRKVFLDSLGTEYLGVNGLLTNILSMLSLVEGGIGTSITYNLYKPLAEDNEEKITALVQLYKKLYGILAILIGVLSLIIYPFMGTLMKDTETVTSINIIYFIFVVKNMISYLNAHKWSLINADQKGYVLARYNLLFSIVTTISKIIVLLITNNYILFLVIEALIFVIQNLWNGKIVNDRYSYIKTKNKYKVDNETKNNLITNFKALFLHSVGGYCVSGTDNILISVFINVKTVGLYSNYTMIMNQLTSLLNPILSGVGASVGNLIATESEEKSFEVFNVLYLVNFWIFSNCTIFLYVLLEPFINWWLGDGLLLNNLTFIVILINFYISGMRSSVSTFKTKAGIFKEDKYAPLIEAVINLGTSIFLVKYFGAAGIFMGTTISSILVPVWKQSKLIYDKVFNKSVTEYFKKYLLYLSLTLVLSLFIKNITDFIVINGFIGLIIKGIICLIITNMIYLLIFFKSKEFKYILNIFYISIYKLKPKINI